MTVLMEILKVQTDEHLSQAILSKTELLIFTEKDKRMKINHLFIDFSISHVWQAIQRCENNHFSKTKLQAFCLINI